MTEGFMNLLTEITNQEPQTWCEAVTMCKKQEPEVISYRHVDHCDACLDFTQDLILIAKVSKITPNSASKLISYTLLS